MPRRRMKNFMKTFYTEFSHFPGAVPIIVGHPIMGCSLTIVGIWGGTVLGAVTSINAY